MPKLHLEPLIFCFAWAALAVCGWLLGGIWAGSLLSFGLVAVLMPVSAAIISKTEDVAIERQVRWGILAIAALALAIWLNA
jgi:esterase/lipase